MNYDPRRQANETEETAECCDLYGEYCYPCNSEAPEEPVCDKENGGTLH